MDPTWTDIIQAIASLIAVPGAIAAFIILFKRDKGRESEIESLSTIASRLSKMQEENDRRYRASKKPHISIGFKYEYGNSQIRLDFANINSNTTISSYEIKSNNDNLEIIRYSINESQGKQTFLIVLNLKSNTVDSAVLNLNYITGEGYTFYQDIILWRDNFNFLHSQSAIVDSITSNGD